jgi:hypothetical protein
VTVDYRNPEHEHVTPDERWQRFKTLRRLSLIGAAAFVVCVMLGGIAGSLQKQASPNRLAEVAMIGFARLGVACWCVAVYGTVGTMLWRCPSCRHRYSWNWWSNFPWRKSCAHCGWRHDSALGGKAFQPSKR